MTVFTYLDLAWRTIVGLALLIWDTQGLHILLFIAIAAFVGFMVACAKVRRGK